MTNHAIRFLPLALLVLSACEQPVGTEAPAPNSTLSRQRTGPEIPIATPPGAKRPGEVTPNQLKAMIHKGLELDRMLDADAKPWPVLDREVRAFLAEYASMPRGHALEQLAAHRMLKEYLLDAPVSPEQQAATSYYTRMLVRNHHGDAGLMADALTALRGTWPEAELREAVTVSIAAGEHTLRMRRACPTPGCLEPAAKTADPPGLIPSAREGLTRLAALR